MQKKFLDRLVQQRFRSKKDIRNLLDRSAVSQRTAKQRATPSYMKGVHNGVFYRIKMPPNKKVLPDMPKLPPPQTAPIGFKTIAPKVQSSGAGSSSRRGDSRWWDWSPKESEFWERLQEWWKQNWPILVLNFGSMCTLTGFTRSDVVELRSLSATGSLCFVAYGLTQAPVRYTPLVWAFSFSAINTMKIFQIMQERKGTVRLTAKQEQDYIQFFMPHGVTPKQFEAIDNVAEVINLKKGSTLIKAGEQQEYVYLIVDGSTRASILGRHLTAASTTPKAHRDQVGGASGAWVGEMTFLEAYWIKEQSKHLPAHIEEKEVEEEELEEKKDEDAEEAGKRKNSKDAAVETKPFKVVGRAPPKLKANKALYTIIAKEDCTILRWSHADLESVMERSTDLRAAMTRAMSSAILGTYIACCVLLALLYFTTVFFLQSVDCRLQGQAHNFLLPPIYLQAR
jgi:CRP-like cAMP-binding protein